MLALLPALRECFVLVAILVTAKAKEMAGSGMVSFHMSMATVG